MRNNRRKSGMPRFTPDLSIKETTVTDPTPTPRYVAGTDSEGYPALLDTLTDEVSGFANPDPARAVRSRDEMLEGLNAGRFELEDVLFALPRAMVGFTPAEASA